MSPRRTQNASGASKYPSPHGPPVGEVTPNQNQDGSAWALNQPAPDNQNPAQNGSQTRGPHAQNHAAILAVAEGNDEPLVVADHRGQHAIQHAAMGIAPVAAGQMQAATQDRVVGGAVAA